MIPSARSFLRAVPLAAGLAVSLSAAAPAAPARAPDQHVASALESSPAGWINLLADPTLADWQRAPFPPTKPRGPRNPWSYHRATGVLHCDATVAAGFALGGQVGLEVEFTPIEFRAVQFKPLP